ncbi:MAG TPA: hypothetical protein VN982_01725 [Candidatus Dormibacteraeota bacterium]|nr:hypothetical protein [Candidatus Dormibacteraeota bacterium]
MTFDTTNQWVRHMLHVYNNRRHDGEIWLAVQRPEPVVLPYLPVYVVELNDCPNGADVLGEVRTRLVDGTFIHDIVPVQQRSEEESRLLRQQVEEHKKRRANLYKGYSIEERLRDLQNPAEKQI